MAPTCSDQPSRHQYSPPRQSPGLFGGRLRGPAGCYNAANLIALAAGVTQQLAEASWQTDRSALWACLFGVPGASWLTAAIVAFLAAGECYHRAWRGARSASRRMTRKGDLLSGLGAVALTVSMLFYGNAALAVASGLLLAIGKFGNAALPRAARAHRRMALLCRHAALCSRGCALAALAPPLLAATQGAVTQGAVTPGAPAHESDSAVIVLALIVRTLICCRGDYLLLRGCPLANGEPQHPVTGPARPPSQPSAI